MVGMNIPALCLASCLLLALTTSCQTWGQLGVPAKPELLTVQSEARIADTPLSYRVSLPPSSSQPEEGWPLLLFLHGAGERGSEIGKVGMHGPLKHVDTIAELQGCIIVAPQCPAGAWWEAAALKAIVDQVRANYAVDDTRLYVTGLSMGGYGTWDLLSRYPDFFAGAVPICGGGDLTRLWDVESTGFALANLLKAKDVPIHAFHGSADLLIPLAESQVLIDALHEAGSGATLTVYPGVGHNSWSQTYDDPGLYEWLFSQRRPAVK
jgi:predicted peptidase